MLRWHERQEALGVKNKLKAGIRRNSCAPKPTFTPRTSNPGRQEVQPKSPPGGIGTGCWAHRWPPPQCEGEGEALALEGQQGHVPVVILGQVEAKYSLPEILSLWANCHLGLWSQQVLLVGREKLPSLQVTLQCSRQSVSQATHRWWAWHHLR